MHTIEIDICLILIFILRQCLVQIKDANEFETIELCKMMVINEKTNNISKMKSRYC